MAVATLALFPAGRRKDAVPAAAGADAPDRCRLLGIIAADLDGRILDANEALLDLMGYAREDVSAGRARWDALWPRQGPDGSPSAIARVKACGGAATWETECVRKDGRAVPVLVGIRALESRPGECVAFVLDLSACRQLEEQVHHAGRLEVIGTLAGGVAHDFNNLLTPILGYSSLLLEQEALTADQKRSLAEIQGAARRGAALTRQLLAFGRRQRLRPRNVDLNEHVANLASLLGRLLGGNVRVSIVPSPGRAPVRIDPVQLDVVLMNLAVNARDAMPTGGLLTIRVAQTGPLVVLTVSDSGTGMSKEVVEKAFEPFFTTKPVGKGTGLGLSTVYGIVKQSGGHVRIFSAPGRGTTFRIELPLAVGTDARRPSSCSLGAAPPARKTGETVLVVEDDPVVRLFTGQVLKQAGYAALEAASAEDALQISRNHPGDIHLLLTDLLLTGIDGEELGRRLVSERPRTRVLYMSGNTEGARERLGVSARSAALLDKPFTSAGVLRKVREALDGLSPASGRPSSPCLPVAP